MAKYLDKTLLLLLLLFLSVRMVFNDEVSPKIGKSMEISMNWIYAYEEKIVNRVEEQNQIILNLKEEVESMKKRVVHGENEQKKLLQQLSERKNETAIREDELNSTLDTLKAEVGSLKQQLLEKDQAYESDIIYNHFYRQNYEPRIFDYSVYKWTIADVKKKVATGAFELESEVFPLKGYSIQAKAKLQLLNDDDEIYISLCFQDNNGTHNPVELTVLPEVTFILRDVRKYKKLLEHRITTYNYLYSGSTSIKYNKFYYNNSLSHKSWIVHEDYNMNDTAEILVLVEPPALAKRLRSTDGVLVQRVTNYKHKLLLGKEKRLLYQQSSYFSTHPNGYRVQVWLYVDGVGEFKGVGLTVRIIFLTNEFDSTLSSSFPHNATVTLFNQRDLTNHLVKTFVGDIKEQKYYYINMATHKQVEDDGYLLSDSLIYQVVIQSNEIIQI